MFRLQARLQEFGLRHADVRPRRGMEGFRGLITSQTKQCIYHMYNLFMIDITLFIIGITLLMMIDIILYIYICIYTLINCCTYCLEIIVLTFARSVCERYSRLKIKPLQWKHYFTGVLPLSPVNIS